jgi:CubicO group peptidase (beta-lactamase class C family)
MLRFSILVLMHLLIGTANAAGLPVLTPDQAGFRAEILAEIDEPITVAIEQQQMPGCVVLIGRPQGIAWFKAYGRKRIEPEQEAMALDTVFDLASLTKPVSTATSVMMLAESGRLSVDDPVASYIPEFAVEGKESITIRDLLVHRSGLIPDNPMSDYLDGPMKARERLFALKLTAPIGSSFKYSDVNFMILGEIVERVSKASLNEFSRSQIFMPLGMSETGYLPGESLRVRAAPTERRNEEWIQGTVHDPRAYQLGGVAGHAGLFGTAHDLAMYAQDVLSGLKHDKSRMLKKATWQLMTQPHIISSPGKEGEVLQDVRGLGWDIQSRYSSNRGKLLSKSSFGHGGFTGTSLWIDPDRELFVIFLSNRIHPNGRGLVNPLVGKITEIVVKSLAD